MGTLSKTQSTFHKGAQERRGAWDAPIKPLTRQPTSLPHLQIDAIRSRRCRLVRRTSPAATPIAPRDFPGVPVRSQDHERNPHLQGRIPDSRLDVATQRPAM